MLSDLNKADIRGRISRGERLSAVATEYNVSVDTIVDTIKSASKMSDPETSDINRTGDDLLARIDELTFGKIGPDDSDNGWRPLLAACGNEIVWLRCQRDKLLEACEDAAERMTRARRILQNRPESGNWGMLDSSSVIEPAIAEVKGQVNRGA